MDPSSRSLFSDTFSKSSLLTRSVRTHTHIGGEVGRLVLTCHLSSALTLALITASPLANAASLGLRSMCSRHKRRREFALGNVSPSHYGIRKSVWCERQFTPTAKRSFCFSLSLSLEIFFSLSCSSRSSSGFGESPGQNYNKGVRRGSAPKMTHKCPETEDWGTRGWGPGGWRLENWRLGN